MKTIISSQNGNVFFYIMLAIFLLGALTYAVTKDRGPSTNIFTDEQAKISAQEIIDYGNIIAEAVQKLRLRGCSDTQISFENSVVVGYSNSNAPIDKSCNIFDANGGNVNWQLAENFKAKDILFPDNVCVSGVGSGALGTACQTDGIQSTELILVLDEIDQSVCEEINKNLNIEGIPIDAGNSFLSASSADYFQGEYNEGYSITFPSLADYLPNAGCVSPLSLPANRYHFYQVLIAR